MFSAELKTEERAPSKLVEVNSEDVGVAVDAGRRERAIEFDDIGAADIAGNFAVKFAIPELATPKAGNAAGELIPNSSASALETAVLENMLLLNNPHNNRLK